MKLTRAPIGGKMWNGYPVAGLVTREGGAGKNSILTMKSGIVTRGVLYDIPRFKGVPYLNPGRGSTLKISRRGKRNQA